MPSNITPARVNEYLNLAKKSADDFRILQDRRLELIDDLSAWREKQAKDLGRPVFEKITYVLLMIFFFCSAFAETFSTAPILKHTIFEGMLDDPRYDEWLSIIAVAVIIGLSLSASVCWHKVKFHFDPVVPNKPRYSVGALVGGLLLSIAYIGFLCLLTVCAAEITGPGANTFLYLIPAVGLIELVLGIPAVIGLSVLYIWVVEQYKERAVLRNQESIIRHQTQAVSNYLFYKQYRVHYNDQYPQQPLPLIVTENLVLAGIGTAVKMEEEKYHMGTANP